MKLMISTLVLLFSSFAFAAGVVDDWTDYSGVAAAKAFYEAHYASSTGIVAPGFTQIKHCGNARVYKVFDYKSNKSLVQGIVVYGQSAVLDGSDLEVELVSFGNTGALSRKSVDCAVL